MHKFWQQVSTSLPKETVKARVWLKQIETLTYNMSDEEIPVLLDLNKRLQEAFEKTISQMPRREGLLKRPGTNHTVWVMERKIKKARTTLHCSILPNKCQPKRLKNANKHRVGVKAEKKVKLLVIQF